MSGTRIVDLPDLSAITDETQIVAHNAGTGTLTAEQIKDYVLGGVGDTADMIGVIGRLEGLDAAMAEEVLKLLELNGIVLAQGTQIGSQSQAITALQVGKANASALTSAQTRIVNLETGQTLILNEVTDLKSTSATQASALLSLSTTVGQHTNNISQLFETTASQASLQTTLSTKVDGHTSSITQLLATTASQATSQTNLTSAVDGQTATINILAAANAKLGASYSVMTDANGLVAGYAITNNGTPAGNTIKFRTDRFQIMNATGNVSEIPFEVVNGVVYIKNAVIGTGRIGAGNLGVNAVTNVSGARDVNEYISGGVPVGCLNFGFPMMQAGWAQIAYTSQVDQPQFNPDGSILSQAWRVEMFLDGVPMAAAEGSVKSPCALNAYQSLAAGFHTVTVSFYGTGSAKIKGQAISALGTWR